MADKKTLLKIGGDQAGEFDLDSLILGSMGDAVGNLVAMHRAAGLSLGGEVKIGDTIIEIDRTMSDGNWMDRFSDIAEMAQSIALDNGYDEIDVFRQMLDADGWVLNRRTLKTPAWFSSFDEVVLSDLPYMFKDYKWLRNIL